jgi:alkylation response protein AidB-like acyl-CoA dehydrogenase
VIDAVLDFARVGLATEQVGGADRAFEMAVNYAKTRIQFDRAIGSFQAIKHKCAEMCLQVEHARTLAYHGLWAATEATQELPVAAAMAGALCSDAYFRIAAENIHIHGGIGFTWEHPAHLYFKRAKLSQQLFGSASFHRELLARRVGIQ